MFLNPGPVWAECMCAHVPEPQAIHWSAMSTQKAGPPTPGNSRFTATPAARLLDLRGSSALTALSLPHASRKAPCRKRNKLPAIYEVQSAPGA